MNDKRCFVPNCSSSEGVPFPVDGEKRGLWLKCLEITEKEPQQGDFVCFTHFKENDLKNDFSVETKFEDRIIVGSVPHKNIKAETVVNEQRKENDVRPNYVLEISTGGYLPEKCMPDLIRNAQDVNVFTKTSQSEMRICRACMTDKHVCKKITDFIEDEIPIMATMMLCAFPLEIRKTDKLPKYICNKCLNTLRMAHKFRQRCLETDDILHKMSVEQALGAKRKSLDSSSPPAKRPCVSKIDAIKTSKSCNVFVKTEKKSDEIEKFMEEIHRENDEEVGKTPAKDVEYTQSLKSILDALENDEISTEEQGKGVKKCTLAKKDNGESKKSIISPEGPKPKVSARFVSSTGRFQCSEKISVLRTTFCVIDDYVFEYGLIKNQIRHLRCIMSYCPAIGEQTQNVDGTFESWADVSVPHNHVPLDELNQRKHLTLKVLRKKLQADKSLNVRVVYEQICEKEPEIRNYLPLKNVIREVCKHQLFQSCPSVNSFEEFYENIEFSSFEKLHFTNGGRQFYQDKFETEDGAMGIVFGNIDVIRRVSESKLMYVDASFKIENAEKFDYQLVTVLVWMESSYYPILFALINRKTQELFKKIFMYLYENLAPYLRPQEIVTEYEANLYYALGETYVDSHIGGSVFYYTQNLYKKVCSLNLSHDLETNSFFRNVYHMLLMLPLLPVNTILDGLNNIEVQTRDLGLSEVMRPLFEYVRTQWMTEVTPDLFCVHRLENRINENVMAPFKKLRDFLLLSKGKLHKNVKIASVVEKIIELEGFLQNVYGRADRKSFGRDLSCYQKKNVLRAWHFIESHPKININNFFSKVLGYIKCMENQLWIWGFYRHDGGPDEKLINATNFSIVSSDNSETEEIDNNPTNLPAVEFADQADDETVVMEAVVEHDGEVVLQNNENVVTTQVPEIAESKHFESEFLKYVFQ